MFIDLKFLTFEKNSFGYWGVKIKLGKVFFVDLSARGLWVSWCDHKYGNWIYTNGSISRLKSKYASNKTNILRNMWNALDIHRTS